MKTLFYKREHLCVHITLGVILSGWLFYHSGGQGRPLPTTVGTFMSLKDK